MSLGLVVLEEKSLTHMPTPQSDDIMSDDIKISPLEMEVVLSENMVQSPRSNNMGIGI